VARLIAPVLFVFWGRRPITSRSCGRQAVRCRGEFGAERQRGAEPLLWGACSL